MPLNPLVERLRRFTNISREGEQALLELSQRDVREYDRHTDLFKEGDKPPCAHLLLDGWAARYKSLEDGRQQISAFLIPGDLFDLKVYLVSEMDHSVKALTPIKTALIQKDEIDALMDEYPETAKGLFWQQMVLSAIEREWVVNIGRRRAYERVAHWLYEIYLRLRDIGATDGNSCRLPVTQRDLADAVGLTPVHLNRVLQQLRHDGLIELDQGRLVIVDPDAVRGATCFDGTYLHLGADDGSGRPTGAASALRA